MLVPGVGAIQSHLQDMVVKADEQVWLAKKEYEEVVDIVKQLIQANINDKGEIVNLELVADLIESQFVLQGWIDYLEEISSNEVKIVRRS